MEKVLSDRSLNELERSLAGKVIRPTDAEYDRARRGFNGLIDRHPAVIPYTESNSDARVTACPLPHTSAWTGKRFTTAILTGTVTHCGGRPFT